MNQDFAHCQTLKSLINSHVAVIPQIKPDFDGVEHVLNIIIFSCVSL